MTSTIRPCEPELIHPDEARMYAALRAADPELATAYLAHLPQARASTVSRLLAALWREDVAGFRRAAGPGPHAGQVRSGALVFPVRDRRAFERVEIGQPVQRLGQGHGAGTSSVGAVTHPAELVAAVSTADPGPGWAGLAAELADAVANTALAAARRAAADQEIRATAVRHGATDCVDLLTALSAEDPAFDATIFLERLCTDGHHLHPCARTRLGMDPVDLLRHDLEATTPTFFTMVGVRRDHSESTPDSNGRDIGQILLAEFDTLAAAVAAAGLDQTGHLFLPMHEWQLRQVVATRYPAQIRAGLIVPVPAARLRAEPTVALRTLLTEPARSGRRYFVKTALDIQITSTRRTISVQSTANGPRFSRLLEEVVAAEPELADRVILLGELAGASYADHTGASRDLSALVRAGLTDRLRPGEIAVPGCALYARSPLTGRPVLAELVDRYPGDPLDFVSDYARLLLGPVLTLMSGYGVGLEAHLQNCVPTFVAGVPTRMGLRDWAGVRVYLPRLARRGHQLWSRAGSVTVTDDVEVMRAKVAYTAVQNHLGEIVVQLVRSHRLDETAGWARIRAVLTGVLAGLRNRAVAGLDAGIAADTVADAASDEAALLAATLPHKALVSMRLAALGGTASLPVGWADHYVPIANPLWSPS